MVRSSFLMARQLAPDPDPGETVVLPQVLLLAASAAIFWSEKKSTSTDLRTLLPGGGVPFPSSAASMAVVLALWNAVGERKPRGRGDASRANRPPPTPRWALSMQATTRMVVCGWGTGMRSSQVRSDSSSAACGCGEERKEKGGTRPCCLVHPKNQKVFKIRCHIESYDTCMKH